MVSKRQWCKDKFAICISQTWMALSQSSVYSTCVNEGCWKPLRGLRAEREHISIQVTSIWHAFPTKPTPFHQFAPVLAYALYLHEQRIIPGVNSQLSESISMASSQRDPCLTLHLNVSNIDPQASSQNKIHVHHHCVVVIFQRCCHSWQDFKTSSDWFIRAEATCSD